MELDSKLKYNFYRIFNLMTYFGMTWMKISMLDFLFIFKCSKASIDMLFKG